VRDRLAEVQRQQQAIEERLLEMRRADEEFSHLQEATAGFDPAEYDQAARLIAERASIPGLAEAAAEADAAVLGVPATALPPPLLVAGADDGCRTEL
jgi:hypothetical protein